VDAGARVALLARRVDRVRDLADDLGGAALALECDVRDPQALDTAAQRVRARLGRVDCLVNSAGVMLSSPFRAGLVDEWRTMVETNLLGTMYAAHAFVEDLCAGGGDVVTISSVAGRKARSTSNIYAATKFGVTGFSDAVRQELLEDDVRVICVEPGAVATALPDHISHEQARQATQAFYHGEMELLAASDIASLIRYAVTAPERVSINEVLVRPMRQMEP
jgi:NADP-dependent 3-hydroxy acid dehydrogenase YdfG